LVTQLAGGISEVLYDSAGLEFEGSYTVADLP
jgi:hypothetical protein